MPNVKTILIIGSTGQLGRSLQSLITTQSQQYQFTLADRAVIDLSQNSSIENFFAQNHFDVVINCAAYTAVDRAEQEAELAYMVNFEAVKKLAEIAKQQRSLFIHISTDYVFDGTAFQPYVEDHSTSPQNVYGASKLKGESAILAIQPNAVIIRTSWVYSEYGKNFVKTMLDLGRQRDKLNVVFDQVGTPTYALDLAAALLKIIEAYGDSDAGFIRENNVQIYHYSNEGVCSWYDFAQAIFKYENIACSVFPIETKDYPTPAKRPNYSVLNKAKFKQQFNMNIPHWNDSLPLCLNRLKSSQLQ